MNVASTCDRRIRLEGQQQLLPLWFGLSILATTHHSRYTSTVSHGSPAMETRRAPSGCQLCGSFNLCRSANDGKCIHYCNAVNFSKVSHAKLTLHMDTSDNANSPIKSTASGLPGASIDATKSPFRVDVYGLYYNWLQINAQFGGKPMNPPKYRIPRKK